MLQKWKQSTINNCYRVNQEQSNISNKNWQIICLFFSEILKKNYKTEFPEAEWKGKTLGG